MEWFWVSVVVLAIFLGTRLLKAMRRTARFLIWTFLVAGANQSQFVDPAAFGGALLALETLLLARWRHV
ncbi:MAG: hypothetical protein CVV05_00815 [Gammaproteobacteria bacterium HGW-Gammaproteobacteria-1]|jgi:hypothetical protein|nr:MAG: hypothetical protein CVV05_00815 [Gammaproteobacteria bacterium HGW-Gammaproteobacteria-1]